MAKRALIVGSSGLVAPALSRRLQEEGWQVLHTSRRGKAGIRFDLAQPDLNVLPPDVDAVFLIAAETSLRRCEDEPEATRAVNVQAPAEIARFYAASGAHLLTLSTNLVFDGTVPAAPATSARRPACIYGRQKAELEEALLALTAPATILRITKIVESLEALAAGWSRDLAAGRPIKPFLDLVCAPVSLSRVVDMLAYSARHRLPGTFQHSGDRDIDYAQIARALCRRMEVSEALIEPDRSADLPSPPVAAPVNTTLAEVVPSGFVPRSPEDVMAVLAVFLDRYKMN